MDQAELSTDLAYQNAILQDVSRTFALTIPQLPGELSTVVGNAYLLCRIADTIEDSDALPMDDKRGFYGEFLAVVAGDRAPDHFAESLPPLLHGCTIEAERDLIRNTASVIRLTHSFPEPDQTAMHRCVRIMSEGMERFQEGQFSAGLSDMAQMDAYCYHVAGVVGEMLCSLFCAHSPAVARHREGLCALAVSFGQGLQMTNILKDIWDDKSRNVCWLPRDVFSRHGFDLADLSPTNHGPQFQAGLKELVGVARAHLENALTYALLIPKSEPGIRNFCLWAIGMAVLTLRKIHDRPEFTSGEEVKISRNSVKATVLTTKLFGRSNTLIRWAFNRAAKGLPTSDLEGFAPPTP
ncbi:MAG: phytoene/squalene synthase family protein [bacterium]|nr:phytoene/squalene synthase family protein [bacterium]